MPSQTLTDGATTARAITGGAAIVVFTSGSTGQPKGTIISHAAFAGKLDSIASVIPFQDTTQSLLVLQLTFIFGIWFSLLTLMNGGTVFMKETFDTADVTKTLNEDRITSVAMVPTMARALLSGVTKEGSTVLNTSYVQHLIFGGEKLGPELHGSVQRAFPDASIFDVYGTTETLSSDFILGPEHQPALTGSIGYPTGGVEFRIADEHGRAVESSGIGELQLRSRFAMNGYLDDPSLSAAAFSEGYFRTGDLACCREDGSVAIVGRIKDIINRGGNKISPLEVEEALLASKRLGGSCRGRARRAYGRAHSRACSSGAKHSGRRRRASVVSEK